MNAKEPVNEQIQRIIGKRMPDDPEHYGKCRYEKTRHHEKSPGHIHAERYLAFGDRSLTYTRNLKMGVLEILIHRLRSGWGDDTLSRNRILSDINNIMSYEDLIFFGFEQKFRSDDD